jgi:hypothetical protein
VLPEVRDNMRLCTWTTRCQNLLNSVSVLTWVMEHSMTNGTPTGCQEPARVQHWLRIIFEPLGHEA